MSGITLMERAGTGVVNHLLQFFGSPKRKRIVVFCGKGNNGGDGLVVARLLRAKGALVTVLLMAPYKELSPDAKTMFRRLKKQGNPVHISVLPDKEKLQSATKKAHILIDALLGTGLTSSVRDPYSTAIESINTSQTSATISVDVPSGLDSETGAILGNAVHANLTVTFGFPKIGLYVGDAIDRVGHIAVTDIGIPTQFAEELNIHTHLLTRETYALVSSYTSTIFP